MTKDGYISKLRRTDLVFGTAGFGTVLLLSLLAGGTAEVVDAAARPVTTKASLAVKQAAAKQAAAKAAAKQTVTAPAAVQTQGTTQGLTPGTTQGSTTPADPAVSNAAPALTADGGRVTSVRFWSLGDTTRVAIEVSSPFTFTSDHLSNPERMFFDIRGARPEAARGARSIPVGDALVNQIRIAETLPKVTRVVLDLARPVVVTASQMANPYRLIVELRAKEGSAPTKTTKAAPPEISRTNPSQPSTPTPEQVSGEPTQVLLPSLASLNGAAPNGAAPPVQNAADAQAAADARREAAIRELSKETPKPEKTGLKSKQAAKTKLPEKNAAKTNIPATGEPVTKIDSAKIDVAEPVVPELMASAKLSGLAKPVLPHLLGPDLPQAPPAPSIAKPELAEPSAARNLSPGDPSLTRVLGLKLGRIVLDPGHGGQDVGTHGPSGYLEKDLVLDVAHRLGALIEQRMGSEVIFTRGDDTYVPLEERTRIANQRKADLFLSIHANSSPVRSVAGVETYVLNFTPTRGSNELAARENASSSSSMHDLKDLVEKIAAVDKANESREFATRLQTSLSAVSMHSVDAARNRGVKRAPFVVLIGASMPSVLAEIGFLTNGEEESLLRKPEHRQKIAEALYKGIASYAETLSRFDLARKSD